MTEHDSDTLKTEREWGKYRKKTPTWAVQLPRGVTIRTQHGVVEAERGDWLAIDEDGELYPIEREVFEASYEPADPPEIGDPQ